LCIVPFDSQRKRGSIVVEREDGSVRVYCKGAPDVLFPFTTKVLVDGDGTTEDWKCEDEVEYQGLDGAHANHEAAFNATVKAFAS